MKILMANKFYFIKGGSERYYFELTKVLQDHGHTVIPFSMKHPRNFRSEYADYFVDNIEFNLDSRWQKLKNSPRIAARILYSMHARKKIEQLIDKTRPDIAHLHMIDHQMSPSILHSLRKYNIPVLLTAHQLKVICPNYRLFNWNTKQVCEKCLHGNYFYPIIEKCHKNSRLAGLLLTLETYLHKLLQVYENYVDIFHVPSKFYGRKFIEAGLPRDKVWQQYYTIRIDDYAPVYESDDYYVYFGRLEEAKGLLTLLQAAEKVPQSQLWLIGEGYYRQELEEFAAQRNLSHVKFLGGKWGEDLKKVISRAKFVIIPSECYDNSPLVVYEAYAMGKPVIGSDIGGIPELIEHQRTGMLFPPGNSEALAENIRFLLEHPQRVREYGQHARAKAEQEFSPQVHYEKIYQLYRHLVNGN